MFKEPLIQWVTELNDQIIAVGQSGYLSITLGGFNPALYGYIKAVMSNVVLPIAYVILALFLSLELYRVSQQASGSGSDTFGMDLVVKVVIRVFICKLAVDNSLMIMEAIYSVSLEIIQGISGILAGDAIAGGLDLPAVIAQINEMKTGAQLGMMVELLIVKFAVFVILGLVQIICVARFIEIYVFIAIAPIPIATIPSDEMSSIAKNFFKSFAAVCIQGAFIYIVVSVFPILFNSSVLGDNSIMGMLLYALILAVGVLSTGRWSKSICNAM